MKIHGEQIPVLESTGQVNFAVKVNFECFISSAKGKECFYKSSEKRKQASIINDNRKTKEIVQ